MEPSSESLLGERYTGPRFTHKIGHGRLGFEPVSVSHIAWTPYTANDLSSSPGLGFSSGPGPGSSSGPGSGSGQGPGNGSGRGTGPGPAADSRHRPGSGQGPGFSSSAPSGFIKPRADLLPNYASWSHHSHWEPQKQPWKFLKVSEPVARGLWKPPEVEGTSKVLSETLPRGQCLLYNWEEEVLRF